MKEAKQRIGKIEEILCSHCNVWTRHTIRGAYDTSWSDDERGIWGNAKHDLLSCNGCNTVTYRMIDWFSEDPEESTTLMPPRGGPAIRLPKNYERNPQSGPLIDAYIETITSYNQQLATLTGAGVRFLIEGICNNQGITGGNVENAEGVSSFKENLQGKINGMVEHGLIGTNQAEILHEIRLLGNDAAHELVQPARNLLDASLDIIEHLLDQLYKHPEHARTLASRNRAGQR